MNNKIMQCVDSAVRAINETLEKKLSIEKGRNCLLYSNGAMDSISLVSLISFVEQKIEDTFNQSIILADEKAMSNKNSPFLSVGHLCDYIEKLLQEAVTCKHQSH